MEHELFIETDGTVVFVHDDDLAEAFEGETLRTTRASHVEPTASGEWAADLAPVGGPRLGPFKRRGQALAAEVRWLALQLNAGLLPRREA